MIEDGRQQCAAHPDNCHIQVSWNSANSVNHSANSGSLSSPL